MSGSGIIEDLNRAWQQDNRRLRRLRRCGSRGSAKPDITSVEAFKRALLAARSIVYPDPAVGGASGTHFENVLDRLGIIKEIKASRP
jgi:hypothetical protein